MILVGDCLEIMRTLDANSVDAIVTDPPYGLTSAGPSGRSDATRGPVMGGFMGLKWDSGVPGPEFWVEALRVAKPGAHIAAFGGTRTFHRLTCAIEDAGWEIRDVLSWLYGSGFPKSKNIGGGWGTALKPAWEPIVLARKPLSEPNVAANVLAFGTGALNIDGCRIAGEGGQPRDGEASQERRYTEEGGTNFAALPGPRGGGPLGRWPANLIHDGSEEVVAGFPQSDGQAGAVTGNEPSSPFKNAYGDMARSSASAPRGDSGSAARFFYCAKASREDRNDGCDGMAEKPLLWSSGEASPGSFQAEGTKRAAQNNHPTVKPTDLMRWLCRLVTPPGGLILDPFAGSGSTGRGAILEGFRFTGIELSPEYAAIAEARLVAAVEQRRIDTAQFSLFAVA